MYDSLRRKCIPQTNIDNDYMQAPSSIAVNTARRATFDLTTGDGKILKYILLTFALL